MVVSNPALPPLSVRTLPATGETLLAEPLVLLHGWGSDSRSWLPVLAPLNEFCHLVLVDLPGFADSEFCAIDQWLQQLMEQLPPRAAYMGWSLGGMLATRLAAQHPERVTRLITLASNLRFVADKSWPEAMEAETFTAFCDGFGKAPEVTLKRFCGLMAKGDSDEKAQIKALRQAAAESFADKQAEHWLQALQLLGQFDNRKTDLDVPGLHIFGDNDSLVPASAAEAVSALPKQQVQIFQQCGHAPHWSQPQRVVDAVKAFFQRAQYDVEKRKVAQSFSRAAETYDSVADLQRQVGNNLLTRLPEIESAETLLDVGAGTGYFTGPLSQRCQVVGLDIAEGMLRFARENHSNVQHWMCADAEYLPLADSSVQHIFSSLAIQWCSQLPQLFGELHRVLSPGGQLRIATLGPQTLYELRDAWKAVDHYAHVNHFEAAEKLQAAMVGAGFENVSIETETITLSFAELKQLTHELKALGAHNMNSGQSGGLTGRARLKAFKTAYESFRRDDGSLPATYEVYYLSASRSA
ncbi:hypothetical protein R50073_05950 [Maricurvus nonylphenolicus]|uniref:malonyl-ACP O-methyltransferase BioC n=1 Tax=Maricurvus nonylphenolicus TaxID=1008307 RepID=UPI0036F41458